jgi:hypothetical protein
MTLDKAIEIFQLLLDKTGSPNVIEDEVIDFINLAINEYINRLFPDSEGGIVNYEFDAHTTAEIQPLIYTLTGLNMAGSGVLSNATINAALVTASGQAGAEYFRIGSIGYGNYPAKFMKQNNVWVYQINKFKQPTATAPRYTLVASGLQFYPVNTGTSLTVNVVKKPIVLNDSMLANELEFEDHSMYNIIALALKASSIPLQNTELLEDVRLTALQVAQ